MLNISNNSIKDFPASNFQAFTVCKKSRVSNISVILVVSLLIAIVVFLFLPWTQNITAKGYVTTRLPEQRPQGIQSVISGRLEKWYVREGDFVEKGDTIVFISEVKSEYFDPQLVERTAEQVDAKSQSIDAYDAKVGALDSQIQALRAAQELKLEQTRNKIQQASNKINIDSIDLVALRTNLAIAENQFKRVRELQEKGLKSLTEFQEKDLKLQQMQAKVNSQEQKLLNQRNELTNARIELNAVYRDYTEKIAKARSDQQSALSSKMDAMANTSKLRNQLSNYNERQKFYSILAPQSGFVTKTLTKGIGEIVKEGTNIATIMPSKYDLAVEVYVQPQDLPLLEKGDRVIIRFDGWPAIVISGWPIASTGVFIGEISALDQFISSNGSYRILVSPSQEYREWPTKLRVGTGANTFMLLNDVPIWYEIWRQLNGFPADYYSDEEKMENDIKLKAPLKSVK